MQTDCNTAKFDFGEAEGRRIEARFDGGTLASNAGALLLGKVDKALRLTERLAACFVDRRNPALIEHEVATLLGQRLVGLALGYEDLNDHDALRHDPLFAALAGKLTARRSDCAPVAGKSTLNRLERSKETPGRYHKINHKADAIEALLVDLFVGAPEVGKFAVVSRPVSLSRSCRLPASFSFILRIHLTQRIVPKGVVVPPTRKRALSASLVARAGDSRSSMDRARPSRQICLDGRRDCDLGPHKKAEIRAAGRGRPTSSRGGPRRCDG